MLLLHHSLTRLRHAFTLLELIVVIVILGVLAAIAVPTFAQSVQETHDNSAKVTLVSVAREAQALMRLRNESAFRPEDIALAAQGMVLLAQPGTSAASVLQVSDTEPAVRSPERSVLSYALSEDGRELGLALVSGSGSCVLTQVTLSSVGSSWVQKSPNAECWGILALSQFAVETPTETVPSETVPSETVPSETVPSEAVPEETSEPEEAPVLSAGELAIPPSIPASTPSDPPVSVPSMEPSAAPTSVTPGEITAPPVPTESTAPTESTMPLESVAPVPTLAPEMAPPPPTNATPNAVSTPVPTTRPTVAPVATCSLPYYEASLRACAIPDPWDVWSLNGGGYEYPRPPATDNKPQTSWKATNDILRLIPHQPTSFSSVVLNTQISGSDVGKVKLYGYRDGVSTLLGTFGATPTGQEHTQVSFPRGSYDILVLEVNTRNLTVRDMGYRP